MLISHSNKFIFLKTQKTAGSSIEDIIVRNFFDASVDMCSGSPDEGAARVGMFAFDNSYPDQHLGWYRVVDMVGLDTWNKYTKFVVERNPWDKMVSHFYWHTKNSTHLKPYRDDVSNFKHWMDNVISKFIDVETPTKYKNRYPATAVRLAYHNPPVDWHIYTQRDKIVVNHVLQYDTLTDQLVSLFNNKFGLQLTKEMVEGTRLKSNYNRSYYTELYEDTFHIEMVSDLFRKEIKQFNYKYGG